MDVNEPSAKYLAEVTGSTWSVQSLANLYAFQNGLNAERSCYGSGMPFINVLEITKRSHLKIGDIPGRVSVPAAVASRYAVASGDVVFNRTSETQDEVGLASVYVDNEPVLFGGFVIRARPAGDQLLPGFAAYALRSPSVRRQITASGQGAVRANVGQQDLGRVLLSVPPRAEQRSIADAIGDCSALVDGLDQLIAKKRQIKQGAMQELLTGKKRLPGFQSEWPVQPFSRTLVRLNAKANQIASTEYQTTGQLPVVDQGKAPIVGFTDRIAKKFECPVGGVIVFGDHTCIVKYVDFDFVVGADGTQILAGAVGQSALFHAYQLQHRPIEPTGYNRHFRFLAEREFVCPPLQEQLAIAGVLSDLNAELTALETKLAKARALKQGLSEALLTGRIRLVPPAAAVA